MSPWAWLMSRLLMERFRRMSTPPTGKLVGGGSQSSKESFHPLLAVGSRPSAVMSLLPHGAALGGRYLIIPSVTDAVIQKRTRGDSGEMVWRYQTQGWRVNTNRWRRRACSDTLSKQGEIPFQRAERSVLPPVPCLSLSSLSSCVLSSALCPCPLRNTLHKAATWTQLPKESRPPPANQLDETIKVFFFFSGFVVVLRCKIVMMAACPARHETLTISDSVCSPSSVCTPNWAHDHRSSSSLPAQNNVITNLRGDGT